jgi:hypothetical protein
MSAVALSLRQPWAWLVLHGKSIENRKWNTKRRGLFWIHASKGMSKGDYYAALGFAGNVGFATETFPPFAAVERGGIVGYARIVDVIPPSQSGEPWHMPEQYGFRLTDVTAVPFVACPGSLGFFRMPESVLSQLVQP